ncbi:hypothetical protein [Melissococcus plutonius]|uniref:Alpha-L-arabinofuranosidase II n=1 Tax=Melissococcus plutonius TaxID=33970 RepID=A0A2Z5Y4E2_9ENTE|nr:hypothetical protein [Melissococcus plutonius]BBC61716.1 alpha-L-arabinofuranosidase II precursor [Melissococcus plutonius]
MEYQYELGNNSFTIAEYRGTNILIYYYRDYTNIKKNPLYNPNHHSKHSLGMKVEVLNFG